MRVDREWKAGPDKIAEAARPAALKERNRGYSYVQIRFPPPEVSLAVRSGCEDDMARRKNRAARRVRGGSVKRVENETARDINQTYSSVQVG